MSSATSFEELLRRVSPTGRWQLLILAQSFVPLCFFAVLVYEQNYLLAGPMQHRCLDALNSTWSTPDEPDRGCVYEDGFKCQRFDYRSEHYEWTIVAQYDLVCSRKILVTMYKSLYGIGWMVGVPLWGLVSDRWGRRPVMCWLAPAQLLGALALALAPSFWVAVAARLWVGFTACGYWKASFVLNMEVAEPQRRNLIGILINTQWMLSGIFAGLAGYFFRDWRQLQLYSIIPALIGIPLTLLLPESPRWLVTNGHYEAAQRVLTRAARFGSDEVPTLETLKRVHDAHRHSVVVSSEAAKQDKGDRPILVQMFTSSEMRKRTFMLIFQWVVVILVFYGVLYYATGSLGGGSPYWTLGLQGALRLVVVYPLIVALDRFGKRPLMLTTLAATGLTLAALAALPTGPEWGTYAMLLQVGAIVFDDMAINTIYTFTSELYPTVMRQTGLGVCSMSSRIGALASPFASDLLGEVWRPLPAIVFGAVCFMAAFAIFLFPEMNMRRLPETVDDAEHLEDDEDDVAVALRQKS